MAPNVNVVRFKFVNLSRPRTWLIRLPFFTRIVFFLAVFSWLLSLFLAWLPAWAALVPSQIDFFHMYRLNTYPLMHTGLFHIVFSLAALVPLLDHFEAEHGTLVSFLMFFGPFATLPGGIYVLVQRLILRTDTSIEGSNVWIFLLLACEALKTHRANPSFRLGQMKLPVWPYPLLLLLVLHFILPRPLALADSLLLNVAGATIGYLFELSWLKKVLVPPERVLRFIESKLNLLGRLPHYVSVDQKTFGRYGAVLPTTSADISVPPGLAGLGIGRGRAATPRN